MAYTPNPTWVDGSGGGTPVTAAKLNHLEAGLVAATSAVANVLDFGAVGDGTTDDTAAITAAIAALPNGGTLLLPKVHKVTSTNTIAVPMIVRGTSESGGNAAKGSRVINATTGSNAFAVTSDNVVFRDLAISNSNAAGSITAGAAIYINGGNYCAVERCRITGHYNGIEINSGYGWNLTDNYIVNNVNYGAYIKDVGAADAGDQSIVGCTFDTSTSAPAAIRYESGGGLKVVNTKVLHHGIGLDLSVADGVTTHNMLVSNSSFEGQGSYGIRLGRAGTTGIFQYVDIVGNQFDGGAASGTVTDVIRLEAGVSHVKVNDNILTGSNSTATGIHAVGGLTAGDFYSFANNHFNNLSTGIQIESTVFGVNVGPQSYANMSNLVFNFCSLSHTSDTIHGTFARDIGNISSTVTYTNLWRVDVVDSASASIEVTVTGVCNGVGGFFARFEKCAYRASGGANPTLVDLVTSVTAGPAFDLQFDTTTVGGSGGVLIGMRKGASGTSLTGRIEIRTSGAVQRIIRN